MNVSEAKKEFIQLWGQVGTEWGISRTMAAIHGLLLAEPGAADTDTVMEQLSISRGNANTNLRELVRWGLVYRELRPGERREFFRAEKEPWAIAQRIVAERKRRELDPVVARLESLIASTKPAPSERSEWREFSGLLTGLHALGTKGGRLLNLVPALDQKSFFGSVLKKIFI